MKEKEKGGISQKVGGFVLSLKSNWKTPPEGRYIPFKEIAAYSVGGIGVKLLISLCWQISLSGTSLLAGSALGLEVGDLTTLNLIATVLNLIIVPVRGMLIDNTRSSKGKFRPYLLYTGIPSAILCTVFALLPWETMTYNAKLYSLFTIYILLQLFYPLYEQAYTTLVQVMSPNSTERADVITVSTFIYSLAPSITGFAFPLIGGFFGGLDTIAPYRIIMPIFGIVGAIIGLLSYSGTKERIIVSKDYVPKVPFVKGIVSGMKNKYQWARSFQAWLVFFQCGIGNITTWYFYYGIKDMLGLSTAQQGALNGTLVTILGAAATPAMLIAPILIRKLGKKNFVIMYTVGSILAMTGMLLSLRNIWVLFAFTFLRGFFTTFPLISDGAINADVLDYQQYKTGDRLEGLLGQVVSFIGTFITMATTYFVNTVLIQNHYGLVSNYNDLYSQSFREPISRGMIIFAIVGYALSLIPFISMYTLTEEDHDAHIDVLKIRAALEDFANGDFSEGQLDEAVEIFRRAEKELEECKEKLSSPSLKRKEKAMLRRKIKALALVAEEKNRFEKEEMKKAVLKAEELLSHSVEELYSISEPSLEKYNMANAMPETTKEERRKKADALHKAQKELDVFHKKAYDYIKARALLKQKMYYENWNEIFEVRNDG